jgi:hypothetical protein
MEKARLQDADAKSRRGIGTLRNGERGENNVKLNNSSTVQHFDAGFQMKIVKTLLLLIMLTKCAISFGVSGKQNHILYSEGRVYKREPELAASPQSTTKHSTGNSSVKKGVSRTKLATATHVE